MIRNLPLLYSLALLFISFITRAQAFTFRFTSTPSQCVDTSVVWEGGEGPYRLMLLPVDHMEQGVERRVIFSREFDSRSEGRFTFPFPSSSKFVAIMSDSTGFGTGGTSRVLTVASSNTTSCLPTSFSTPRFYFYLDPVTPTQCSPMSISWGSGASGPVNVYCVIPRGRSFSLGDHTSSFDWTANVRSGTEVMFVVGDSHGEGSGGSTDIANVRPGASRCIGPDSPSVTPDGGNGNVGLLPGQTSTRNVAPPRPTDNDEEDEDEDEDEDEGGSEPNPTSDPGDGEDDGEDDPDGGDGESGGDGENGGEGSGGGGSNGGESEGGSGSTSRGGSDGGTVVGPIPLPTDDAIADLPSGGRRNSLGLILGLVFGLLTVLSLGGAFFYRRHKNASGLKRTKSHHRRLLSNTSDMMGEANAGGTIPIPPNTLSGPYSDPWMARSIESLGSAYRTTPFIWPRPGSLRHSSSSSSSVMRFGLAGAGGGLRRRGTGEGSVEKSSAAFGNVGRRSSSGYTPISADGIASRKSDLPSGYIQRLRGGQHQQSTPGSGPDVQEGGRTNGVRYSSLSSSAAGVLGSHDEDEWPAYFNEQDVPQHNIDPSSLPVDSPTTLVSPTGVHFVGGGLGQRTSAQSHDQHGYGHISSSTDEDQDASRLRPPAAFSPIHLGEHQRPESGMWGPRPPPPPRLHTGASGTSALSEIPPTYSSLTRQNRKD